SHAEKIKWFEDKFKLSLETKKADLWHRFIEITERRNLFVHSDGLITEQYLNVCGYHGVSMPHERKLGTYLTIDQKYFNEAVLVILELGIKLAQIIWTKLTPSELESANYALTEFVVTLLNRNEYTLAKALSEFALDKKRTKLFSEEIRLIFIVDLALSVKFDGNQKEAIKIVNAVDWSASDDTFKLAISVIKNEYKEATRIMKNIGKSKSMKKNYQDWPLFRDFRSSSEFRKTYKDIYKEEFIFEYDTAKNELKIRFM
ncbi:hypothetical protein IID24_05865, partial [Patescibacteria group bacterium]|nr:hypothetical protein [Patescibacteria group bacterium]